MRVRKLLGLVLTELGLIFVAASLVEAFHQYTMPVGAGVLVALAILLLAVGLIVLITEILEGLLSRGQAALVDGLQAG